MSLNTLQTAYVNGQIIDASIINELTLSLTGQFVGRDANGIPTAGQSLGTLAVEWGNLYCQGIIINGLALDVSLITAVPNRVVSGQSRSLSTLADFLRANGAALSFTVEGATTDLVLSVNNAAASVSTDLVKAGISAAPAANNTALVNDTTMVNDLFAGEDGTEIIIDTTGTEVDALVGQIVAFKTATGEIFRGLLKSTILITDVYRGFYLDSAGSPLIRGNLSNNDTLTLMKIGWVFIEDNGTTVDVTYTTPVWAFNSPSGPSAGDYWFDIQNQLWKRYSGTTWDQIDRILVGEIVSDDTNTIASRSTDFSNKYDSENNVEIGVDSTSILKSKELNSRINIYGTEVAISGTKLSWNITTDLESPQTESASTLYYIFLTDEGEPVLSETKPYYRPDLKGYYHPWQSWRCLGKTYNDSGSDLILSDEIGYNPNIKSKEIEISNILASAVAPQAGVVGNQVITTNTIKDNGNAFADLLTNQGRLIDGEYSVNGTTVFEHTGPPVSTQVYLYDATNAVNIVGLASVSHHTILNGSGGTVTISGTFKVKDFKLVELKGWMSAASGRWGYQQGSGHTVKHLFYKLTKIG